MRESIYQCPDCDSRISEFGGMDRVEDPDHGYCHSCESIVHQPENVGERIHLYTKTALACRPHETLEELAESCEALAQAVRQFEQEGFEVVQTSGDGHIYMERLIESSDSIGNR